MGRLLCSIAIVFTAHLAYAKPKVAKVLAECLDKGELKTCMKACKLGSAKGCYESAVFLYEDDEKKQALPLYDKACRLGSAEACTNLGVMLVTGEGGVTKNIARGNKLLLKECDAGDGIACAQYGNSFVTGRGVPKDVKQAIEYHRKGCKLGSKAACRNLDEMKVPR
jgi:uncharacterized protein